MPHLKNKKCLKKVYHEVIYKITLQVTRISEMVLIVHKLVVCSQRMQVMCCMTKFLKIA